MYQSPMIHLVQGTLSRVLSRLGSEPNLSHPLTRPSCDRLFFSLPFPFYRADEHKRVGWFDKKKLFVVLHKYEDVLLAVQVYVPTYPPCPVVARIEYTAIDTPTPGLYSLLLFGSKNNHQSAAPEVLS